jgi:16S rRNA (guanine(966)-N(2))-methyltransferase RsmD
MTDRVKTSLFSILNPRLVGSRVLDLFAGTGSMGIEALSRGATSCTFVETDRTCEEVIRKNLTKTRLADRAIIHRSNVRTALEALHGHGMQADIVLFDPPFAMGKADQREELEGLVDYLAGTVLAPDGLLVYHHEFDTAGTFSTPLLKVCDERSYGRNRVTILRHADVTQMLLPPDPTG